MLKTVQSLPRQVMLVIRAILFSDQQACLNHALRNMHNNSKSDVCTSIDQREFICETIFTLKIHAILKNTAKQNKLSLRSEVKHYVAPSASLIRE